uniref:squidulin n=1 Tax=Erigeron canadensis TaxID=72917 RepID=UPI001CB942CB|nr:squidulin [Erigeron canadensis]
MKLITYNPKNLFKSKKNRSVSRHNNNNDPSSFGSYATTSSSASSSSDTTSSHLQSKSKLKNKSDGVATPTSVLQHANLHTHEISSDEWSEISTDVQFEMMQAFRFIDKDDDGKITKAELEAILNRIGGSEPQIHDELTIMLSEIDRDGDGIITLEEFGAISAAFGPPSCDTELKDVFEFFDTDKDGRITADELFEVFKSLGDGDCTLEECRSMISNVDKNGDGFVCFEDFTRMMEQQK